ncbi:MAG: hypothetical protein JW807_16645 [Spirochaetes bacterium]|nr:hypothetical protein [Spirochaetota bacterium]
MTTKKNENARHHKLKAARAKIKLDEIQAEHVLTAKASESWQTVRASIMARLDDLPDELLHAVKDRRSSPGVVQEALQAVVYRCLNDLADPALVDRALKKGRS